MTQNVSSRGNELTRWRFSYAYCSGARKCCVMSLLKMSVFMYWLHRHALGHKRCWYFLYLGQGVWVSWETLWPLRLGVSSWCKWLYQNNVARSPWAPKSRCKSKAVEWRGKKVWWIRVLNECRRAEIKARRKFKTASRPSAWLPGTARREIGSWPSEKCFTYTRFHLKSRRKTNPATCGAFLAAANQSFEFALHWVKSHMCRRRLLFIFAKKTTVAALRCFCSVHECTCSTCTAMHRKPMRSGPCYLKLVF